MSDRHRNPDKPQTDPVEFREFSEFRESVVSRLTRLEVLMVLLVAAIITPKFGGPDLPATVQSAIESVIYQRRG